MSATAEHRLATESFRAMGTTVTVMAAPGHDAVGTVQSVFRDWEAKLSRFNPDSELSRLNAAAGQARLVGPLLLEATVAALEAARVTDGLFDPLLARRMEELGYDSTFDDLPADRHDWGPASPLEPDAWRRVVVDAKQQTVMLPAGTGLDLGGLAKGMAVDAALQLLIRHGAAFAAVNAGGDLAVHGLPPRAVAWHVAVDGSFPHELSLRSGALATSSTERRRWRVNGEVLHHLIDPRTGMPSRSGLVSVSAAATTCREAEVAAKVALLLGPTAGRDFLDRLGISAVLVSTQGDVWQVGNWQ